MFGFCMIIYFILTIVAVVMNSVSYRKNKKVNPHAILICLAAGIVFAVGFLTLGDSASGGGYIYYINGQRVGSGSIRFSMWMFSGFMSMVFSWFLSWGLGYLFGHRGYRDPKKTSTAKLILSGCGVFFGATGILYSVSIIISGKTESSTITGFLSVLSFTVILVPSILSIARYVNSNS